MLVGTIPLHDDARADLERSGGMFRAAAFEADRLVARGCWKESRQLAWDSLDLELSRPTPRIHGS